MAPLNLTIVIIFLFFFSSHASHVPSLDKHKSCITCPINGVHRIHLSRHKVPRPMHSFPINVFKTCHHRWSSKPSTHSTFSEPHRALQTRGYLLKVVKELEELNSTEVVYLTVQDCEKQITDSIDQLSQAIKKLRRLNKLTIIDDNMLWHISNVETWVSTALTDASYCVQSSPGHRMSKRTAGIKVKVQNVAEVTSNGLALFHRYPAKYKAVVAAAKVAKKSFPIRS